MNAHYDETPIENQKWQFKYGLKKEFIDLLFTEKLTLEQCRRLDVLHHGTEGQIRGKLDSYFKKF